MISFPKISISFFVLVLFSMSAVYAKDEREQDNIELAGDILQIAVPVTGGLIAYFKDDDEGLKSVTYTGLTSTIVTHTFKRLIPAERPDNENTKDSYVSGHTSFAMCGATFLQIRYGYAYGIPAFLAAAFVGWSRVYAERHHQSDVFRGTIVGVLSALYFTTEYKKTEILFFHDRNSSGLILSFAIL